LFSDGRAASHRLTGQIDRFSAGKRESLLAKRTRDNLALHVIGELYAGLAQQAFADEDVVGNSQISIAVGAVDYLSSSGIVNHQMLPTRPAFEENVGHPDLARRISGRPSDDNRKFQALTRQFYCLGYALKI
jgi:hypothetical protein